MSHLKIHDLKMLFTKLLKTMTSSAEDQPQKIPPYIYLLFSWYTDNRICSANLKNSDR